jgi:glycosyltransferase 2 family protein
VTTFYHAFTKFLDDLGSVGWQNLGIAIGFNLLRLAFRCPAWRNILRAAYPKKRVPLVGVSGAYLAGVGINSILPARAGDALKLFLVKRQIVDSHYPTLGATLIPETLLDSVVAAIIVGWALAANALPGLGVLPSLDTVDWSWPYRHQTVTAIVIAVIIVGGVVTLLLTQERIEAFWSRVRQGFAILTQPRRYFLGVATWQLLSWACRLAAVYFFLEAFHMPANLHNAFVVLSVQSISTLLPITPGGVGTIQGLLVATFRNTIPTATVLSFSVGMHVATVVASLVVGFTAIGLMLRTFRWRRVVQPEKPLAEH